MKEYEAETMARVSNIEALGQIHREVTSSTNFKVSWTTMYPLGTGLCNFGFSSATTWQLYTHLSHRV